MEPVAVYTKDLLMESLSFRYIAKVVLMFGRINKNFIL